MGAEESNCTDIFICSVTMYSLVNICSAKESTEVTLRWFQYSWASFGSKKACIWLPMVTRCHSCSWGIWMLLWSISLWRHFFFHSVSNLDSPCCKWTRVLEPAGSLKKIQLLYGLAENALITYLNKEVVLLEQKDKKKCDQMEKLSQLLSFSYAFHKASK